MGSYIKDNHKQSLVTKKSKLKKLDVLCDPSKNNFDLDMLRAADES